MINQVTIIIVTEVKTVNSCIVVSLGQMMRCAQELNKAVGYFLAKDMQTLYTVEKPGFKHLVSKLDPKYTLPSGKYFAVRKQNCRSSLNY